MNPKIEKIEKLRRMKRENGASEAEERKAAEIIGYLLMNNPDLHVTDTAGVQIQRSQPIYERTTTDFNQSHVYRQQQAWHEFMEQAQRMQAEREAQYRRQHAELNARRLKAAEEARRRAQEAAQVKKTASQVNAEQSSRATLYEQFMERFGSKKN